jgi:DNA polymerase
MGKLKEGKKLIRLFCMPQPANRKIQRPNRITHPAEWERFKEYARVDIVAMRECCRRMPRWNWDASAVAEWHCDQRINERGFYVDRELTTAGVAAAETEKQRIAARFRHLTLGIVDRPSQREPFLAYLNDTFAMALDNTRKDTFESLLKEDAFLDPTAQELIRLSMAANKTSTAKYAALQPAVQSDGRFRGGLQFAGASRTRRWAGRLFQGHNLPSRGLPPADLIEQYIDMLKLQCHDLYFGDELMRYGAAALRGVVIAAPEHKLAVADLSNIEGRMLAWVAHEAWKLDAFRAFDAGTGPDLYKVTASIVTGIAPNDVPKEIRNSIGKVTDLASGYMGGASGYQTFARAYNVRLADYWDTLQRTVDPGLIQRAKENLQKPWGQESRASLEISETEWLASEACKLAWRARHPATVTFWYDLQSAAKAAIKNWGQVFEVGRYVRIRCVTFMGHRWLLVKLPSGRYLTYFEPHLVGERRDETICYYGEAAEAGKTNRMWTRVFTHGGKMTGNICQTLARDILMPALQEADAEGYLPVLSVHDEAVCEVPDDDRYSAHGLATILARERPWAVGLPLSAEGFETHRYRK